mmetsp:Transcript_37756/g.93842  ORF Transcript_37756/g.93842 Transcript_37756/m.93842 type:complete len:425 (+) Transcript_37756:985-2259(+)
MQVAHHPNSLQNAGLCFFARWLLPLLTGAFVLICAAAILTPNLAALRIGHLISMVHPPPFAPVSPHGIIALPPILVRRAMTLFSDRKQHLDRFFMIAYCRQCKASHQLEPCVIRQSVRRGAPPKDATLASSHQPCRPTCLRPQVDVKLRVEICFRRAKKLCVQSAAERRLKFALHLWAELSCARGVFVRRGRVRLSIARLIPVDCVLPLAGFECVALKEHKGVGWPSAKCKQLRDRKSILRIGWVQFKRARKCFRCLVRAPKLKQTPSLREVHGVTVARLCELSVDSKRARPLTHLQEAKGDLKELVSIRHQTIYSREERLPQSKSRSRVTKVGETDSLFDAQFDRRVPARPVCLELSGDLFNLLERLVIPPPFHVQLQEHVEAVQPREEGDPAGASLRLVATYGTTRCFRQHARAASRSCLGR